MRLVAAPGAEGQSVQTWSGEAPLTLEREVLVSGREVQAVEMLPEVGSDRHFISLELEAAASRRFEQVTAANVGRRLAVVVGDRVATAPVIREKIAGGKVAITARSEAEIQEMHRLLAG
jgi:preprotein translocase subunit SecD